MDACIDSHVHLDLIFDAKPEKLAWLKSHHCTVISWAFGQEIRTIADLKHYLKRQSRLITTMHQQDHLHCLFLTGIHPRNIPADLAPEAVESLLLPYLEHPLCLGIGEIGLEIAAAQEKEILYAQLELVRHIKEDRSVRIGVHTPRENKPAVAEQIMRVLDAFPDLRPENVVDHCTHEILESVMNAGYMGGVTLSPLKTSLGELRQMLVDYPDAAGRIMCNTDSGREFYEDLVIAFTSGNFLPEIRSQIFRENAGRFFCI